VKFHHCAFHDILLGLDWIEQGNGFSRLAAEIRDLVEKSEHTSSRGRKICRWDSSIKMDGRNSNLGLWAGFRILSSCASL
jgi:hypothetical protein